MTTHGLYLCICYCTESRSKCDIFWKVLLFTWYTQYDANMDIFTMKRLQMWSLNDLENLLCFLKIKLWYFGRDFVKEYGCLYCKTCNLFIHPALSKTAIKVIPPSLIVIRHGEMVEVSQIFIIHVFIIIVGFRQIRINSLCITVMVLLLKWICKPSAMSKTIAQNMVYCKRQPELSFPRFAEMAV